VFGYINSYFAQMLCQWRVCSFFMLRSLENELKMTKKRKVSLV